MEVWKPRRPALSQESLNLVVGDCCRSHAPSWETDAIGCARLLVDTKGRCLESGCICVIRNEVVVAVLLVEDMEAATRFWWRIDRVRLAPEALLRCVNIAWVHTDENVIQLQE